MSRPVIFLDIDGVIQSPRYSTAVDECGFVSVFEPAAMHMVRNLIIKANCHVVISSSWRHGPDDPRELKQIFRCCGFKDIANAFHHDWRTKSIDGLTRGHEIAEWLSRHQDIENYLILDDDPSMLPEQADHFVQTDSDNGILLAHYDKARTILGIINQGGR